MLSTEGVLVDVRASLLSVGTEKSKVEAGRQGLVGKARARPDQAREVVEKARRDGVRETVRAVRTRLDQPTALGYSAAGLVLEVGANVRGISPGDRVACGGGDYAVHAEVVHVPGNLCVRLPHTVEYDSAAFATVGSIAMHGVRQADVRLGERVAVIGLGLVGQLTAQLLRASGCEVVGIDLDERLAQRAIELGSAQTAFPRALLDSSQLPTEATECDAVIVTAATTSSDPVRLAPRLCRDRGRVVIVGDVTLDVPRGPYYDREIDLRFSRSYGPGRYDRQYEERGLDYPIGYVRWTERRNMAAFVALVASKQVDTEGLIAERVPVEEAPSAYDRLVSSERSPLGIILEYEAARSRTPASLAVGAAGVVGAGQSRDVNVIGAGSFAQRVLIPALEDNEFRLRAVASASGLSAASAASRFGFDKAVQADEAIADSGANLVVVATRHASHAALGEAALRSGKAVFIEKPPCLTRTELQKLRVARVESGMPLFVGFNRRHARLARELRRFVRQTPHPVDLLYRINAGRLPATHWLNDPEDGGGRLVGEGCHFIDFACWLAGAPETVHCIVRPEPGEPLSAAQSFQVSLGFGNGSLAVVLYTASGSTRVSKEYVEVHSGGRTAVLDDFRRLTLTDERHRVRRSERSADKGHARQFEHVAAVLAGTAHDASADLDPLTSMDACLMAQESALQGCVTAASGDSGTSGSDTGGNL